MAEQRTFQMHEKLLLDVIKRQAGSLQKAVLEGVMNSIEAGASRVEVELDTATLSIRDDGRGFRSRDEIEKWFETFGQPHEESEGKVWGQFRMGRGQLFAFGRNTWTTGPFVMEVDIEDRLGYDLTDDNKPFEGCRIEVVLYNRISDRDIYETLRQVESFVKYVKVPVVVNGKVVSRNPDEMKWGTESTDEAYIRLTETSYKGLDVYNLGVFVKNFPGYVFGASGVVVSKQRLEVNFARNDIISSCRVWQKIKKKIDTCPRVEKTKTKTSLTDEERINLIDRLNANELDAAQAASLRLYVDTSGHSWSINTIRRAKFLNWSMADRGDRKADRVLQEGTCLVLDEDIVGLFDCKPEKLLLGHIPGLTYIPFCDAVKDISGDCRRLPEDKWTPRQRVWVSVINNMQNKAVPWQQRRKICVGTSDTFNAWTDGHGYICFAREFLERHALEVQDRPNLKGLIKVAEVLLHETAHDADSSSTANHGPKFDKEFRRLVEHHFLEEAVCGCMSWLTPGELQRLKNDAKNKTQSRTKETARRERRMVACTKDAPRTETPKKGTPRTETPRTEGHGGDKPTSKDASMETCERAWALREEGRSWSDIEKTLGLRESNGMTAYRCAHRHREKK